MYYHFAGFKVDVFGYDEKTETYDYSVETPYSSKVRKAKKQYKAPDKRNEWIFQHGTYIYIIDPRGKKQRLFLD
jgi:hypothetical protein